jgi:hypothetical protein
MVNQFDNDSSNCTGLSNSKGGGEVEFGSQKSLNSGQVVVKGKASSYPAHIGRGFDARFHREGDITPI